MPPSKRAKIFSMFDALKGLKEALAAKERIPEERKILAADAIEELNRTLIELEKGSTITVVYYCTHGQCDDQEITLELFTAQYIPDLSDEQQIVQAEVDTEQNQEYGHHILREGMEQFHTAGNEAKTTGAGAAKGSKQAKEKLFALIAGNRLVQHKNDDFQNSHTQINQVQNPGSNLHSGYKFTNLRAGAFCTK